MPYNSACGIALKQLRLYAEQVKSKLQASNTVEIVSDNATDIRFEKGGL